MKQENQGKVEDLPRDRKGHVRLRVIGESAGKETQSQEPHESCSATVKEKSKKASGK